MRLTSLRHGASALALCLLACSTPGASAPSRGDAGRDASSAVDSSRLDSAAREVGATVGATAPLTLTLAFGPGLEATLTAAGQLTITRGGATVLATHPGAPLLSGAVDAVAPQGFHDPKNLASDAFSPLPPAAITMDSPGPGVLHLVAIDPRADVVLVSLALASDGGFYSGLGERYDHVDPRGEIVGMQLEIDTAYESSTTDRHVPVPWLVSSRGYGVLVKDRQAGAWDVAATDASVVRATFEGGALDVTVVVDPDPLAVVARLTQLTGLQRATPVWALAPMMWRHVDSQAELLGDVAHIRALHIPTTAFWIDDGWQVSMDTLDFDPTRYTDPASLTASMRSLGFKVFAWNSPYLRSPSATAAQDEAQALYRVAADAGYFVEQGGAPMGALGPGSPGPYGLIDFTSAAATSFWVSRASRAVSVGLDGFKLDYAEDMIPSLFGQRLGLSLADGETERTARDYPLGYHGAYRQALAASAEAGSSGGGVLIVRASTYGGAAVADIVWPGDLDNGFERYGDANGAGLKLVGGLPSSIVALQTLAASGFALYGADTGGYRGGAPTKESLLRWAEHTALSMVMQLGPGENKYPWNYDADAVATYTALARLHQRLVPYLATLLAAAQADGTPTVRPLPFAYPTDPDAPAFADDEYLLGPSLLVAPVVAAGATSRSVHLPPGEWFPYRGGAAVAGPTTLTAPAPLGQPPLYVLAGAILPLLPDGIDTLVAATDPSTVSLAAMAGHDAASAWVRGPASATCLDGGVVRVADDASGVLVAWTPSSPGDTLTLTLDLSLRAGTSSPLVTVTTVSGSSVAVESSAGAVAAAAGAAGFLSGDQAVLRLVGPSSVRLAPGP